jgi:phosphinothricin acetyltransferase
MEDPLRGVRYASATHDLEDRDVIVTRVSVRPGEPGDLPALTALYNHYVETTHVTFDTQPFSVDQRAEWFSHYALSGPHRVFVAVAVAVAGDGLDGLVGYATSGRFRDKAAYDTSVEASVYLRAGASGVGAGTALYAALFDALRSEDVHRAYAGVALPNDASIALHRKFGFVDVGTYREVGRKFGRYWDVTWLEKNL